MLMRSTLRWATLAVLALLGGACGSQDYSSDGEEEECPLIVENGGGGIDDPPNGAALCPLGACNYQSGEGCDAGEACLPSANRESQEVVPACVEAAPAGDGKNGDACTAWAVPSDCAPGYFCADDVCRRLCCGSDWSACEAGTSCFRPLALRLTDDDGSTDVSANVGLCFPTGTCHVLEPDSCADDAGRTCKLVDPTGAQACIRSGSGEAGEACEHAEFCGPGLSCVGGACRRLCRAEACGEPGCGPDEGVCVHMDRNPEGVGECTPDFVPQET